MCPPETPRSSVVFSASNPGLGKDRRAMKASKFTDAQKAFIIKQTADGTPVA
jgi:hypothetical protein